MAAGNGFLLALMKSAIPATFRYLPKIPTALLCRLEAGGHELFPLKPTEDGKPISPRGLLKG
ncbi:hypothetical protein ANO14919_049950 [Xylariales sp. No.14919]|nr:hypothetical protein ANO14919_049950 [Xylariales sp. No.14919]